MLPERLFNSPQVEPLADTSVVQKQAFSGSDRSLDNNSREFKNTLSSSISTNKQLQQKQRDSKQTQSNTSNENLSVNEQNYHHGEIINTQLAKNNTDGEDTQSVKALVDKNAEISTVEEGKQFNINLSQNINPVFIDNTAGKKVATDGKVLPDKLLNIPLNVQGSVALEQVNSSTAENKDLSKTANSQGIESSQNRLLSKADKHLANVIVNPVDGKVADTVTNKATEVADTNKNQNISNTTKGFEFLNHPINGNKVAIKQEELLTSLKKLNPEKTSDIIDLSKKELQQKLASLALSANKNVTKDMGVAMKSSSSGELNSKIDLNTAALVTSSDKQKLVNISIETGSSDPKTLLSAYSTKSLNLDTVKAKLSEGNNFSEKSVSKSAENLIQPGVSKHNIADNLSRFDMLQHASDKQFTEINRLDRVADQLIQQTSREESVAKGLTANDNSNPSTVKPATSGTTVTNEIVSAQTVQSNNTQAVTKPAELTLPVSLPPHQWKQKFAEQVSMMILRGNTRANIRLDPPELGPMAIRVNHNGAETQIQFQVSNPVARDLIDAGMQRLREMLEQHGFENVDVDVRQQGEGTHDSSESLADTDNQDDDSDIMSKDLLSKDDPFQSKSLVDIFA
ncbi:MAG: flagellar hook-length control protein FliK [Gammaproteobacteria bacterium]|nr:flagellar hook-length control protein FliK [Gammaproteobacteria bacterium]